MNDTVHAVIVKVDRLQKYLTKRLDKIEEQLNRIERQETKFMALGQDILDAVAAETTAVDSVIAYIQGLVKNGTVTPEQGKAILDNLAANKAKLEKALTTAVTPPPTP